LCGFGWFIGNVCPLIFEIKDKTYEENGINFNSLSHLESIGLIHFDGIQEFARQGLPQHISISYYGQKQNLVLPKEENNDLPLGHVLLTKVGQELAPICGSKPVDGFIEHVMATKWNAYRPKKTEPDSRGNSE